MMDESNLEKFLARIWRGGDKPADDSKPLGGGALVGARAVLTCAHVLQGALVEEEVWVDFPRLAPLSFIPARRTVWQEELDVAGLELLEEAPPGAGPAWLAEARSYWGHPFLVGGFPKDRPDGAWVEGKLRARNDAGWLQVEGESVYQIEKGFSGAPVWDGTLGGVAGIVNVGDLRPGYRRAAGILPVDLLLRAWPGLQERVQLLPPGLAALRREYLKYLQDAYARLDFKGLSLLEAIQKASGLSLQAIYTPTRARPDLPEHETWQRMAGRVWRSGEAAAAADDPQQAQALAEKAAGESRPVEDLLRERQALVVLGDPGSGKSTLLKMLALELAGQPGGRLPILIPLNAYAKALEKAAGGLPLQAYLAQYFAGRLTSLAGLGLLFDAALQRGQALVLLDGLDEVQEQRGHLVGLVEDFARQHVPLQAQGVEGNQVVVTSRFVGYREAPLTDPRWYPCALEDWGRPEIEGFVKKFTYAVELAIAGGAPGPKVDREADRERGELLEAVFADQGITRLAGNPLLLTLLALIKRQGVTLPHRRVELYRLYIRTLLDEWPAARALDKSAPGKRGDYLEDLGVIAALALWLRQTNPQAGLVEEARLRTFLITYFSNQGYSAAESRVKALEFLKTAHETANLLIERGLGQYGFIHLTFEEYLAGYGLAQLPAEQAAAEIWDRLAEPGWWETLALGLSALGVVNEKPGDAGGLVERLLAGVPPAGHSGLNVLLAGEVLADIGPAGLTRRVAGLVRARLEEALVDGGVAPPRRARLGDLLDRLDWQPEDYYRYLPVPADTPRVWMAKYLTTNEQYRRFLESPDYDHEDWWRNIPRLDREGRPTGKTWGEAGLDWLSKSQADPQACPDGKRILPRYWEDKRFGIPRRLAPVVGVSWFEAAAYCRWLDAHWDTMEEGRENPGLPPGRTRLPAEAEWETAAGGLMPKGRYPWSQPGALLDRPADLLARANYWDSGIQKTTVVGTYPQGASPWSLQDLAGNAWEWQANEYQSGENNPALLGGAWDGNEDYLRVSLRLRGIPSYRSSNIGFRCARSLWS